ncbi:hypothetical protein KEM55_002716 [Ascosphaera atra]|nr:hypothetical protein KEM55_002716 [Ascosphaera atra]
MGWLTISRKPTAPPSCPLDLVSEAQKLEEALKAASLIMNDDIDGAAEGLKHGDSSFHKVCAITVITPRRQTAAANTLTLRSSQKASSLSSAPSSGSRKMS